MREARAQDPSYVAAHWLYITYSLQQGQRPAVLAEYRRLAAGGDGEMACYAATAARPSSGGASEAPAVYAMARRGGIGPCLTLLLSELLPDGRDVPGLPATLQLRRRATAIAGELASPWLVLVNDLAIRGDSAGADSVLNAALPRVRHPLERIKLLAYRANNARERGRAEIADARWRALGAAAERDGRPGVLYAYRSLQGQMNPLAWNEQDMDERAKLLRGAPPNTQVHLATAYAGFFIHRNEFARAVPHLDRAIAIVDSYPDPDLKVTFRLQKGRALSKMGLLADAERTLLEARRFADGTNLVYSRAEIWHNLSHTYESAGDMVRAVAASDSFVAYAARLDHDPIRIMSRRDAGLLRLTLGWDAAAHAQFDAMVRLIDAERQNNYWAGEYYERVGNTRAAMTFFHRGLALDPGERSLNLAGLARMYEALGMSDSAATAAFEHDRFISSATAVPLAPAVLSRAGRHDDALRIARRWAEQRESAGNVQGAALARLEVAQLSLDAGRPRIARAEARRAERLAASLRLTAERIEAMRLLGLAFHASGRRADALPLLTEAARLAERHGDVRQIRETHLALGNVLGDASDEALAAYDRAARAVEEATSRMAEDMDRARYRGAHMASFDAAVLAIMTNGRDNWRPRLARWSARRKAAALGLAANGRTPEAAPFELAALQARLPENQAVVDYLILPNTVAALVVRRNEVALVRLPIGTDTLRSLARRLTAGFARRRARVDLVRITFDEDASAALYDALVEPLRATLAGVTHVTIVPDGAIHHVPFAALSNGARHVLDDLEVDYAPSIAFVGADHRERWRGLPLLLVRTEVPGAESERTAIRHAWQGPAARVVELANGAATERALTRAGAGARIVHFATHAEASDRNPLATYLRLSPGDGGDGLLHIAEIATADFAGRLVVLAACESVAGELLSGEGFMGLSRAFLVAGAAGVIATRWPVDSSAAKFSAAFYAALAEGNGIAAATRAAQFALRRNPATSHPFFWAGYVAMQGNATVR